MCIDCKKAQLRISYFLYRLRISGFKYLVLLLFFGSTVLSSAILFPNLFTHSLFMIGIESPRILQLEGVVVVEKGDGDNDPGIGATIEIGGYKTVADQDGKFKLKFLSKSYEEIPLLVQIPGKTVVIKRVSFRWDEYKKMEAIAIGGK